MGFTFIMACFSGLELGIAFILALVLVFLSSGYIKDGPLLMAPRVLVFFFLARYGGLASLIE